MPTLPQPQPPLAGREAPGEVDVAERARELSAESSTVPGPIVMRLDTAVADRTQTGAGVRVC